MRNYRLRLYTYAYMMYMYYEYCFHFASYFSQCHIFQILCSTGAKLEELDLSGGILSTMTEAGLQAVTKYCVSLRKLALSLLRNITGISLLPMLKDDVRASQLTDLMLTCKQVGCTEYSL